MTEKFEIIAEFVKDMSSETPNVETYFFVKENISKYHLNINISSKGLKNKMIEVSTSIKYEDKNNNIKKSYFEIIYITIVKINEQINDKKTLEKILLCDVQNMIYPRLEKSLLNLIHASGFTNVEFGKKVDFEKIYNNKFN